MIQRYLGNKSPLVGDIASIVGELARPGELIFDAFSGTLAVSLALKARGYRVAANDVNFFSWIYAQAYLGRASLPAPEREVAPLKTRSRRDAWHCLLSDLVSPYKRCIPRKVRRTDVFDHYCEAGANSAFKSSRGQTGRRRFFSADNALLIDRSLSRLRWWYHSGAIGDTTRCILTASLLDATERISNTQGTYHDFPRAYFDPRALKVLTLVSPDPAQFVGPISRWFGKAEDSLEFVSKVPRHEVLYLDPPYNFRQYSSYYFMLNLLARYPEIDNLDEYFANIQYVRGQNMEDDFSSSFCSSSGFLPSLETLVKRAKTKYVLLSYFDGRNHWGHFKSGADDEGRRSLELLFSSELFVPKSMKCVPVTRLNYQSYGGYKARPVQEFLFVAEKRYHARRVRRNREDIWTGEALA
jgi:adenine-specific DNA-methyltransferase